MSVFAYAIKHKGKVFDTEKGDPIHYISTVLVVKCYIYTLCNKDLGYNLYCVRVDSSFYNVLLSCSQVLPFREKPTHRGTGENYFAKRETITEQVGKGF